jgi:hypothetical protein
VGAPRTLIIGPNFNPIFSVLFQPRTSWRIFLRACAQIADNFQRNYFVCGNLSLVTSFFWSFHWCLCTPYRSAGVLGNCPAPSTSPDVQKYTDSPFGFTRSILETINYEKKCTEYIIYVLLLPTTFTGNVLCSTNIKKPTPTSKQKPPT